MQISMDCVAGACVYWVFLGSQVYPTTNIVYMPVSNQGLFTKLVNTLTKTEPKHDPIPIPNPASRPGAFKHQRAETGLTTNLHHWLTNTSHTQLCTLQSTTVRECVTLQWLLSPPMFIWHQSTIMRTVGLDRKPCILCYYNSAIITQEVFHSWLQPRQETEPPIKAYWFKQPLPVY